METYNHSDGFTLKEYISNEEEATHLSIVDMIKWIAYSIVAFIIVSMGIIGNVLNLIVLTRPHLAGVMYVYLLALAVSNLCVLLSAFPALYDISSGFTRGDYITAFYQAHLKLPLINSFMASSVYIIMSMSVNRFIAVYKPFHFQKIHTLKNATIAISGSFMGGIILHIPLCFQNKIINSCWNISHNNTSLLNTNNHVTNLQECIWSAEENFAVSASAIFKSYLFCGEIFLRFGPIIILTILNTLIIRKFVKNAKKKMNHQRNSIGIASHEAISGVRRNSNLSSAHSPLQHTSHEAISSARRNSNLSSPHSPHSSPNKLLTTQATNSTPRISFKDVFQSPATTSQSENVSPPLTPSPVLNPALKIHRNVRRRKSLGLQNPEERMLVLVLIIIVIKFVVCATPAAILSILYSAKLDDRIEFQIFRAVANNLELLNFAVNFYIYCMCSSQIRKAFVSVFTGVCKF